MDNLANVWPQGGVFAFSGIDGPTCHAEPFVATGTHEGIGWKFWLEPSKTLFAGVGKTLLMHRRFPTDFCLADCWHCTVLADNHEGYIEGAFVDRQSMTMLIAFPSLPAGSTADLITSDDWVARNSTSSFEGTNWHLAIHREPPALKRRFGVAISYASNEDALARARAACATDLAAVIEKRTEFHRSVPVPESLTGNNRRAYYKAVSLCKANVESPQQDIPCRWSTRDRVSYRDLGLWETAFGALGLQHLSVELAHESVRALFAKQMPDGLVPSDAAPGPPAREQAKPGPPLLAWSICRQSERLMDVDFLTETYPKLLHYLEWYEKNRKKDNGLFGWEMARDNDPGLDRVASMTAIDLSSYMASEYYSIEKIARCLEKGDDVARLRERRVEIAARINELLWDNKDGFYYDLDEFGEFVTVKTPAGFMPLLGQIPDGDQAEALRTRLMNSKELWAPFPVPAVSQDEPAISRDTWRGPAWVTITTLLYYGLMAYGFFQEARLLARGSVQEAARCYPRHGRLDAPGVIEDFQGTAACFINFANEIG